MSYTTSEELVFFFGLLCYLFFSISFVSFLQVWFGLGVSSFFFYGACFLRVFFSLFFFYEAIP
jgi:hypothetical protein